MCTTKTTRLMTTTLLVLVVALAGVQARFGAKAVAISERESLEKAIAYLPTVAYNTDLELCREAPRVAPNVYWIASDNLLAYKALEPYDWKLASTIRSRLVEIGKEYKLPVSPDGVPLSLRYEVMFRDDETLEIPPRDVTHMTLHDGSYLLRYDIANGTARVEDWREYADLLLLVALSDHNRGDHSNAVSNFMSAAGMWDGMGLRDKAYESAYGEGQAEGTPNAYATYKLGLLLYVSGKLGVPLSFEQDVVQRIWLMQNQTSGGIFTHITPDGTSGNSDTNTETTAFVILGMTSIQNSIPEFRSGAFIPISGSQIRVMDGMMFVLTGIAVFIGGMLMLYLTRGTERTIEREKQQKTRSQQLSQILLEALVGIFILLGAYSVLVFLALRSCLTPTC